MERTLRRCAAACAALWFATTMAVKPESATTGSESGLHQQAALAWDRLIDETRQLEFEGSESRSTRLLRLLRHYLAWRQLEDIGHILAEHPTAKALSFEEIHTLLQAAPASTLDVLLPLLEKHALVTGGPRECQALVALLSDLMRDHALLTESGDLTCVVVASDYQRSLHNKLLEYIPLLRQSPRVVFLAPPEAHPAVGEFAESWLGNWEHSSVEYSVHRVPDGRLGAFASDTGLSLLVWTQGEGGSLRTFVGCR